MTDTQHAPGPWATDGKDYGWCIMDLRGARVATVWRDGAPLATANARLIAAAPDLLAALQAALPIGGPHRWWHDDARAAIAKATGGQS